MIEATQWIKRGIMLVNRDCLSPDDPDSWESLWLKKYGNLKDFPFDDVYEQEPLRQRRLAKQIDTNILKAELISREAFTPIRP